MKHETAFKNLKKNSEDQYIEEYDRPHYEARDLYDRRSLLKKNNYAIRRFLKYIEDEDFDGKVDLENKASVLMKENSLQIELIRFTQSIDGTSDEREAVFTGVKSVWYDKPFRELIHGHYHGDINDFYYTIEHMKNDEIRTSSGSVPKNLALQFIQNLRLIVSGGSKERADRGIFKIHHDLQIAPTHVVKILEELDITCRPQCVMKKSENEYERGKAPDWLVNLADKPHEIDYSVEELTEEEKRVFAKAKGGKITVIRGGCKCRHNKSDHDLIGTMCVYHETCGCNRFKLRTDTKQTIEVR
jgi:hypothetical protein